MIFGRYTSRQVAEKRAGDSCADARYAGWWQVREEEPPAHLPEYRYVLVFEPPSSEALVNLHPEQLDCPVCHGEGTRYWNPSAVGDPQCEASAKCDHCHGTGLSYRAQEAA